MSNALQKFGSLKAQSDFVFVVYYRGHWCPFCIAYIKSLQAIVPSIEQANGTPIIITAEDEEHLAATLASTGYTGNTINDPDNLVAQKLKDLGKVNVVISDKSGYPNGMAQPALLIMRKDGDVLYSWAIEPSLMNLGGAKDRVVLSEVWEDVQKMLRGESSAPRAVYSRTSFFTGIRQKLFG